MDKVFKDGRQDFFVRGDVIDHKSRVFYMQSGVVGLYSVGGQSNFIFAFRKGEFFPLVKKYDKFLSDRDVVFKALGNVRTLSLDIDEFEKIAFSPSHVHETFDSLTSIMEFIFERIDNFGQVSVYKRLLYRLNFMAERMGEQVGDRIIVEAPMSHADTATSINTSRETVNRLMKQLEKNGLVTIKNQMIVINSVKELKKLINESSSKGRPSAAKLNTLALTALAAEGAVIVSKHLDSLSNLS